MTARTFRDLISNRELKLGTGILEFDSPGIGQIAKAGGAEFAFVDLEHSGFGIDTLKRILRYLQAAELPAMVRPPSNQVHHIATALDAGGEALLLRMVSSAAEAAEIVRQMKYPPAGARGVALAVAHDRYRSGPTKEKLEEANAKTVCIPLIETRGGIEEIEQIAALDGVDALFIGHFDLSCSLGIAGEFDNPVFTEAIARVLAAAQANAISAGRMVSTAEEAVMLREQGFDLICYSADVFLLREAIQQGIEAIRARVS